MICLKKNNIPQHDEPVENDTDFSLDFKPPPAAHAYHKLKYPIHKTIKFPDRQRSNYVRNRH